MPTNAANVSAPDFWKLFFARAAKHPASGNGREWTTGMYEVLHHVQVDLSMWCKCLAVHGDDTNGEKGELLKIDMMWFRKDGRHWDPPMVAIEHENAWSERAALVDFWRVSQICAPLRVCIAYAARERGVEPLAQTLLNSSRDHGWRRPPFAQDLLILGHGGMQAADFRAWMFDGTNQEELPMSEAPQRGSEP